MIDFPNLNYVQKFKGNNFIFIAVSMPIKHYFVTNRESNVTYLYFPSLTNKAAYEKLVYIPDKFETMTQSEVFKYKRRTVFKFLMWGIFNRNQIEDPSDTRIVISRFIDINSYIMMVLLAAMTLNRFSKRIDMPFMQLMFEDRFIKLSHIRMASMLALSGFGINESINHVCDQTYLYDIMLKYKEKFIPNTLYSSNCEELLKYAAQ